MAEPVGISTSSRLLAIAEAQAMAGEKTLLLVTLLGLGIFVWRKWPDIRQKATDLSLDRACLNYTAPPDRVVFETDPNEIKKLTQSRQGYRLGSEHVWYTPREWTQYPLGGWEPGPAFLHRRTTPSGKERLVAVSLSKIDAIYFYPAVYEATELLANRKLLWGSWTSHLPKPSSTAPYRVLGVAVKSVPPTEPWKARRLEYFRIYAGQPDSADKSHFTIRITFDGRPEMIDGYLRDDDTVDLIREAEHFFPTASTLLEENIGTMIQQNEPPSSLRRIKAIIE